MKDLKGECDERIKKKKSHIFAFYLYIFSIEIEVRKKKGYKANVKQNSGNLSNKFENEHAVFEKLKLRTYDHFDSLQIYT